MPLGSQPLEQLKAKEFVAVCCVSIVEFYSEVHQLRAEVYSMGHILVVRFTKITGGISNHLSFDKVCLRRERVPTCSPHQIFYFDRKIKFPDSLPKVFHSFWI